MRRAARVGAQLSEFVDVVLGEALLSLAYAAALGDPDGTALSHAMSRCVMISAWPNWTATRVAGCLGFAAAGVPARHSVARDWLGAWP